MFISGGFMKVIRTSFLLLIVILFFSCTKPVKEAGVKGDYIGETPPGKTAKIFAPGFVSTGLFERDLTMTPEGDEFYFSVRFLDKFAIAVVKKSNSVWQKPKIAEFSGLHSDIEPYIQPDGKKMYFVSKRPLTPDQENEFEFNMWVMKREGKSWSKPEPVGEPINGAGSVFYPSITKDGSMYFTRRLSRRSELIFKSEFVDGKFAEPVQLPEEVNQTPAQYNALVSPDEDFIIVPTWIQENTKGASDYYISFKDKEGNWSKLINMGDKINTPKNEYTPALSPDGKYFFFQRTASTTKYDDKKINYNDINEVHNKPKNGQSDIFWISTDVIKELNPYK